MHSLRKDLICLLCVSSAMLIFGVVVFSVVAAATGDDDVF